jgi:hypothetical protein
LPFALQKATRIARNPSLKRPFTHDINGLGDVIEQGINAALEANALLDLKR